jgi:myo-inositol 2-dehydrogenase / D-chiro-inositol 1-dehydrogenase
MSEQRVRVGLLGAGEYARNLAGWIQRIDGLTVARCYDPDPARKRTLQEDYGIEPSDTLDDLLADETIQAVIVALPTRFHADHIMAAAQAGRHVYVTRPVAEFLPAARLAIAKAAEAGIILQVGHYERKRHASRQMKRLIDSGAIGRLKRLEMSWPQPDVAPLSSRPSRFESTMTPAHDLLIRATPAFDLAQYLAGPIREVTAQVPRSPELAARVASVVMDFTAGCLGHVGTSTGGVGGEHILIHGAAGYIAWNGCQMHICSVRSDKARRGPELEERVPPVGTPELDDLCEFIECVRTGTQPEVSGEAGLTALCVSWAAISSSQHRRPVAMEEVLGEEQDRG